MAIAHTPSFDHVTGEIVEQAEEPPGTCARLRRTRLAVEDQWDGYGWMMVIVG